MDAEETMINRLKVTDFILPIVVVTLFKNFKLLKPKMFLVFFQAACGYEFTNKLHRMYVDIQCGHDLYLQFSDYLKNESTESRGSLTAQGFSIQVRFADVHFVFFRHYVIAAQCWLTQMSFVRKYCYLLSIRCQIKCT